MGWNNCCIILLIGIALIFSLGILAPVTAIDVAQGDVIYKNETVDLSLALAWPDFAVAYCNNGYYGCNPPDQVIQITGNMHKYWLDPAIWRYGTYYRWDGEWHRGENSIAFTINPGTRPVIIKDDKNQTISNETIKGETSPSRSTAEDLRAFMIAKGDDFTLKTHYPSQFNDTASLWAFEFHDVILGMQMDMNEGDYSHKFTDSDTGKMTLGDYKGFLQFSGRNGFQDVYYNAEKDELDTPYDDDIIPDVSLEISSPEQTLLKYTKLTLPSKYNDDVLIPITVTIVEPSLLVTEVVRDEDKSTFWIHGTTTWSEGTPVTVKLDPSHYALPKDIKAHTWVTGATGNISVNREFNITIPYDESELALGVHEIKATVDKNHIVNDAYFNFRVTDTFVYPTPTPAKVKRILTEDSQPMVTPTTYPSIAQIVRTPAPQSPVEPVVISTGGSYAVVSEETIQPTKAPVNVTAKPTPTPTRDPNITVPLPWWVAVLAVALIVLRKR